MIYLNKKKRDELLRNPKTVVISMTSAELMGKKYRYTKITDKDISNTIKNVGEEIGISLANFYDRALLECASRTMSYNPTNFPYQKIIGYRKVRVPRYLEITVPVIEKHYDYDDFNEGNYYVGLLLTFRTIRVCQIGTKWEERAIYKKEKSKGSVIKFKRYSNLRTAKRS